MKNKQNRLNAIRIIISNERIGSQDELLKKLYAQGFELTQATLSRDLKQLKVVKTASNDGMYVYVLPNASHSDLSVSTNLSDNITDIAFSGNMCVITTKPGYASAISVPIDSKGIHEILGTIAGDNTILLILREGFDHQSLMDQLVQLFPSITNL